MSKQPANPQGGGVFIALGAFAGVFIGRIYGQTTIGLLAGIAAGAALALIVWLRDRRA